jgi:peptide-methionine (R)-S-oxide reductase
MRYRGVHDREHLCADTEDEIAAPFDVFGHGGESPADGANGVDIHSVVVQAFRLAGQCYITHMASKTDKTDAEWQAELTPTQYQVLRKHGTEPRGSSPLNKEKRDGTFKCAGCGQPLFTSETKYESGSGWPSFYAPLKDDAVETTTDQTYGMTRTEVHCASCGGHLGHVFEDGPNPTGLRYCMNGTSLAFDPGKDKA